MVGAVGGAGAAGVAPPSGVVARAGEDNGAGGAPTNDPICLFTICIKDAARPAGERATMGIPNGPVAPMAPAGGGAGFGAAGAGVGSDAFAIGGGTTSGAFEGDASGEGKSPSGALEASDAADVAGGGARSSGALAPSAETVLASFGSGVSEVFSPGGADVRASAADFDGEPSTAVVFASAGAAPSADVLGLDSARDVLFAASPAGEVGSPAGFEDPSRAADEDADGAAPSPAGGAGPAFPSAFWMVMMYSPSSWVTGTTIREFAWSKRIGAAIGVNVGLSKSLVAAGLLFWMIAVVIEVDAELLDLEDGVWPSP